MRDFGDDVFEGTAKYYAQFRPRYPAEIFNDVVKKYRLDGFGRLLDLGCGTGELAIPLAKYFDKVLAVDPEVQMLNEGIKKARKLKIDNIEWQIGSSKSLTEVKGHFKLITMGQSFHWMDQDKVLDQLYELIDTEGGLVIIGSEPTKQNTVTERKNEVVKELIAKYLGPKRRAGSKFYVRSDKKYEDLLRDSKFTNFEEKYYEITLSKNVDEIIGQLFSMSWASKKLFGIKYLDFENELRQKINSISSNRNFVEHVRFGCFMLTK